MDMHICQGCTDRQTRLRWTKQNNPAKATHQLEVGVACHLLPLPAPLVQRAFVVLQGGPRAAVGAVLLRRFPPGAGRSRRSRCGSPAWASSAAAQHSTCERDGSAGPACMHSFSCAAADQSDVQHTGSLPAARSSSTAAARRCFFSCGITARQRIKEEHFPANWRFERWCAARRRAGIRL